MFKKINSQSNFLCIQKSAAGFTVIEILVGIVIIVIISMVLAFGLSTFRESSFLTESDSRILGLLQEARARTLASDQNTTYGVHFEQTKAVLFSGASYNANDATNEIYLIPTPLQITQISLTGGVSNVIFQRLTGLASSSGTLRIQSQNDASKFRTITILPTGASK